MPRIERRAQIVWEGNVARGAGSITAASGAFTDLPYSLPSRIGQPEGKTSPEELLAAAHGGCITMSFAGELVGAGTPPARIDVTCLIVMDEIEGQGHQIVASHVDAVVAAEGLDEAGLQAVLVKADENCPFSALLKRAGAEVHVTARLAAEMVDR
jgi:osmotically inducible protein OsmC